jgi:translocation and assembly module TamB
VDERTVRLRQAATVSLPPGGVAVEGLALDVDGGSLELAGRLGDAGLAADATLDRLPLSIVEAMTAEPGPQGFLSGRLGLEGSMADPRGTASITFDDLAMPGAAGVAGRPADGKVEARWQGGRLMLDARLEGFAEADLAANLELPLEMRDGAPAVPLSQPVRGAIKGGGDAALLWELVPAPEHAVEGRLVVDLKIGGSLAAPELSGGVELHQGRYENLEVGTIVEDLELQTDLSASRRVRFTARGTDGGKGTVAVEGSVVLDDAQGFPLTVTADLAKAKVLRRDDVTAALTGRAEVSGSLDALAVKGRFETKGVEIRLADRLPPQVVDLHVVEVNLPEGAEPAEAPTRAEQENGRTTVALDVAVDMPNQVYVRGFGVDSVWKVSLAVSGTAAGPKITGGLTSINGTVSFLGKTFQLQESTVDFSGGEGLEPFLNLTASHESGGLVATVHITGTPSSPKIEISSVPALPQDEVLSRVLFGKSAGSLGFLEAAQLAQVAANLASGDMSGGTGIFDTLRKSLGLDVLQVEAGEGGIEAGTATIGKYLTEDVLVNVQQGIKPGSGSVSVELKVTPEISVESTVTETGNSKLGVFWSLDY